MSSIAYYLAIVVMFRGRHRAGARPVQHDEGRQPEPVQQAHADAHRAAAAAIGIMMLFLWLSGGGR